MNSIERLTEIFKHFPGIGPRQAKRFVYYLLSRDQSTIDELQRAITSLSKEIGQCPECMRHFPSASSEQTLCHICTDATRDDSRLCVVPRDIDLDAIEKSGTYKGRYFVLGGSLPILEKEPERRIRITKLQDSISGKKDVLKEVILALNANAEGENTADYIKEALKEFNLEISLLGRGLSTGAELEYADPETLKNAFRNRSKQ